MTFIRSTVILVIAAIFGIALAKTITSNQQRRTILKKLDDSFPRCKEELGLPGNNYIEFGLQIIANLVDNEKVGCALNCLATKMEYVKDDEIVNTKLMDDVNNELNIDVEFKDTVRNCITKTNDKLSQKKCKLIKGLFGCVLTGYKNSTAINLMSILGSSNRQILLTKFTDIDL